MSKKVKPEIAIVDYGMGNLFSVKNACAYVGLSALITADADVIYEADAVILPGVGAFGDAMENMKVRGLDTVLKKIAGTDKPLIAICLGMQMLMEESFEFGHYAGVGIIPGKVVRFNIMEEDKTRIKVPHVGWNQMLRIYSLQGNPWAETLLDGMEDGVFMYFVHSFYVIPKNPGIQLAKTRYGNTEFCSALKFRNIIAVQAHPERSGANGIKFYQNLAKMLRR